jgi:hypothetical protein
MNYSPDDGIEHSLPRSVLAWGEARAREYIQGDTQPSEQRNPRARWRWPGELRRFWLVASLLVGSQRGKAGAEATPSPPSDGGEGRGEEARWFLWIAPLLGPLPIPSSLGEEGNLRKLRKLSWIALQSTAAMVPSARLAISQNRLQQTVCYPVVW